MSQPYVGEIRIFAGNFAPQGWSFCEGQALPISEYETLFNLIGTTYGGDGQATFNLPDLRGRLPIHMGTDGATGTTFSLGQNGGVEQVTLTTAQLPAHSHVAQGLSGNGNQASPAGGVWAASSLNQFSASPANASMSAQAIGPDGGSQPHNNLMPYLCLNFIISQFGVFPSPG